jgi:hypothetical protein
MNHGLQGQGLYIRHRLLDANEANISDWPSLIAGVPTVARLCVSLAEFVSLNGTKPIFEMNREVTPSPQRIGVGFEEMRELKIRASSVLGAKCTRERVKNCRFSATVCAHNRSQVVRAQVQLHISKTLELSHAQPQQLLLGRQSGRRLRCNM